MKNDKRFTSEINRLAIPAIITGLAEPIVSLTDAAVAGKLDHNTMSGVGLGTALFMIIVWIFSSIKGSISAIVGKHFGENKLEDLGHLVGQALFTLFLLGTITAVCTYISRDEIFRAFYDASGEILNNTSEYYSIRVIGLPFMLLTYFFFGVFRGFQNTKWGMTAMLSGAICNVLLDFLLAFGIEGVIPTMGLKGIAIASVISQGLMLIICLYFHVRKVKIPLTTGTRIHKGLGRLLLMSMDLLLRTALLNGVFLLANRVATQLGEFQIAAHTIAVNLWLFAAYFIDGFSNAGIAIAARLKGENDQISMAKIGILLIKRAILISFAAAAMFVIIYPWTGDIFNDNPAVIGYYEDIFLLIIISQPINALAFIMDGIFIGRGEMRRMRNSMALSTVMGISTWFILGQHDSGIKGIWISLLIWMIFRAFTLTFGFYKSYYKYFKEAK